MEKKKRRNATSEIKKNNCLLHRQCCSKGTIENADVSDNNGFKNIYNGCTMRDIQNEILKSGFLF